MRPSALVALLVLAALAAGCGRVLAPGPSASPPAASDAELKYRLFAQVGQPFWCDRDVYPVARQVPDAEVRARVDAMRAADPSAYAAVVEHLALPGEPATADEERAVYQELKRLQAVTLTPAGGGHAFDYVVGASARAHTGTRVRGTIGGGGAVVVTDRTPTPTDCPV